MIQSHRLIIPRVWDLYRKALNHAAAFNRYYGTFDKTYSAQNLDCYLLYRSNTDEQFEDALRSQGLAISSVQHMIRSLHLLCMNLGIPQQALPEASPYLVSSLGLLEQRAFHLFGNRLQANSPHLMLTLDTNMIGTTVLDELLAGGMTVARINCAYGDESDWSRLIAAVREAESRLRRQGRYRMRRCKIYMDIAGPKLRIHDILPARDEETVKLVRSDKLRILLSDPMTSLPHEDGVPAITVNLPQAFNHVANDHSVFIDDGKIHGIVTSRNADFIDVEIVAPHSPVTLKSQKGINLPDSRIGDSLSILMDKDKRDLAFVCRYADIAGISFIHHPDDLRKVRSLLYKYGNPAIAVIAKIETKAAVRNFAEILYEGLHFPNFGIMAARGDLAIEIGFEQLSVIQEEILTYSHAAHIPVILATQILDTLAKKGTPSRAEMTDLSFGSEFDCLMLNKGAFMVQAVAFIQDAMPLIAQTKSHHLSIARPMQPILPDDGSK